MYPGQIVLIDALADQGRVAVLLGGRIIFIRIEKLLVS